MNKSAIALAVAAALAASSVAVAETTLYGSIRTAVTWVDPDTVGPDDDDDDFWDFTNHGSRLGVVGSEDLGNGLSVIYQYEFGVDSIEGGNFESNRPKILGLKGGFGQVTVGTQQTPYYNVAGRGDNFNASFYANYNGGVRDNNVLIYQTPNIAGFLGEALIRMDGAAGDEGIDRWDLAGRYSNGPFGVGLAYQSQEVTDDEFWTASAGFSGENFSVALFYEHVDFDANALDDTDWFGIYADYTIGNGKILAGLAFFDPNADNNDDINSVDDLGDELDDDQYEFALGYQHNLSNRTRLWVEYQQVEDVQDNRVNIGMRHDF